MEPDVPTHNELHLHCLRWAAWHRSRRLLAPAIPKNLLGKMRTPAGYGEGPDAEMSARLQLFNTAVNGQPMNDAKMAFLCYYLYRVRMTDLMDHYDLSKTTIFSRIETVRERAYLGHLNLMVARFVDDKVINLDARRKLRHQCGHSRARRCAGEN
jgi:hypothetical protein